MGGNVPVCVGVGVSINVGVGIDGRVNVGLRAIVGVVVGVDVLVPVSVGVEGCKSRREIGGRNIGLRCNLHEIRIGAGRIPAEIIVHACRDGIHLVGKQRVGSLEAATRKLRRRGEVAWRAAAWA